MRAKRWTEGSGRRRRNLTRVLVPAVVGLLVAGCGSSSSKSSSGGTTTSGGTSSPTTSGGSPSSGSSGGDYIVGASLGLTGPIAEVAGPYRQGIAAYYQAVNSSGGINGHQVKFVALDDALDVTTSVANVRQLVSSDHVSAMYFILSNIQGANASYLTQSEVVTITQAVDSSVLHPANHLLFAGGIVEPDEAPPMVDFGVTKLSSPQGTKAAVITANSAALQELDTNLKTDAKAKGMSIVGNQVVPTSATDLSSEAEQFASAKPNIVFSGLIASQEPSFIQTLRQRGFTGPVIQYDGGSSYPLMKQLADPNIYMLFSLSFGHNTGPQVTKMTAAAKAAGTSSDAYFFAQGYVQAYITGQGLTKCGYPCNGAKLATSLESLGSINTGGLTYGPWIYSPTDHSGVQDVAFFSWSTSAKDAVQDGTTYPMPNT
jgi:branched-chain amino acid transport system substrate-binding protein